jgi:hypothetical protein
MSARGNSIAKRAEKPFRTADSSIGKSTRQGTHLQLRGFQAIRAAQKADFLFDIDFKVSVVFPGKCNPALSNHGDNRTGVQTRGGL